MNYTYILSCRDGSLYTDGPTILKSGFRRTIPGKEQVHKIQKTGLAAYYEEFETREMAMKREYEIKHMTREMKLKLIHSTGITESAKRHITG